MSLKKFRPQDIMLNTMKAHPSCEFFIFDGNTYYNNLPYQSGTINHGANLVVSAGCVSLYELNIDRLSASTDRFIGGTTTLPQPVDYDLASGFSSRGFNDDGWITATSPYYGYSSTAADSLVSWWQLVANVSGIATDSAPASDHEGNITDISADSSTMGFNAAANRPSFDNGDNGSPGRIGADGINRYVQSGFMTASCNFVDTNDGSTSDYAYVSNPLDNALSFTDGTASPGQADTAFSMAIWVKPQFLANGSAEYQYLISKGKYGEDEPNIEYQIWLYDGDGNGTADVQVRLYDSSTSNYIGVESSVSIVCDGTGWFHLVVTYDASETAAGLKIYIQGSEYTGDTKTLGTYNGMLRSEQNFRIGTYYNPPNYTLNGNIAEVAVWSSELSANDAQALYDCRDGDIWDQSGVAYTPWDIPDNGRIYSYVSKDSTYLSYNSVVTASDANYVTDFSYGDIMTKNYPLSASIVREYMQGLAGQLKTGDPTLLPDTEYEEKDMSDVGDEVETCSDEGGAVGYQWIVCNKPVYRHYWALKSTLDAYGYMSEHYKLTASVGPGGATVYKDQQEINLISIPSIFFGSKIKPGSLSLKWYYTGSLAGELRDTKHNGELIQVSGASRGHTAPDPHDPNADGTGSVAGVVLYNEGFILLTGSWALNDQTLSLIEDSTSGSWAAVPPSWKYFGAGARDGVSQATTDAGGSTTYQNASFTLSFKGTTETQTMTMFANAQKGKANFSNNPTYLNYSSSIDSSDNADPNVWVTTSSFSFEESPDRTIVNFVSSAASDYSASFQRQVYISRVAIYDDNKNLMGVATLANPVRKKEDEDLTFKLKLDI